MITKLFEIRDAGTFIPCFAISFRGHGNRHNEDFLTRRAGYGLDCDAVLFGRLDGGECQHDPYEWSSSVRTFRVAHDFIERNFDNLESGSVVDVEFILNETKVEKRSEYLDR